MEGHNPEGENVKCTRHVYPELVIRNLAQVLSGRAKFIWLFLCNATGR